MKFLASRFKYATEEQWSDLVRRGLVSINGVVCSNPATVLLQQDTIMFDPPRSTEPEVDRRLRIVFEDADMMVVSKSGNIPVSEGGKYEKNTLIGVLTDLLASRQLDGASHKRPREEENDEHGGSGATSRIPSPQSVLTVHRLDKETSGLTVVAKNPAAAKLLTEQFARHTDETTCAAAAPPLPSPFDSGSSTNSSCHKTYVAVVHGIWAGEPSVTVSKRIGTVMEGLTTEEKTIFSLSPLAKVKMCCYAEDSTLGKSAKSTITCLGVSSGLGMSLVSIDLLTGRTHQARLHCAVIGFPIVGDKMYRSGATCVADDQYLRRARGEEFVTSVINSEPTPTSTPQLPNEHRDLAVCFQRHFLHAVRLRLHHPFTNEAMSFSAAADVVSAFEMTRVGATGKPDAGPVDWFPPAWRSSLALL